MKELNFTEDYISLNIIDDGEGNPLCSIKLDDEQELTITEFELINLKKIMDEHIDEILSYFDTVNVETGEIKVMGIAPKTNKHYVEEDYEYEFGNGVMDMLH